MRGGPRIGFLWTTDPDEPTAISGEPFFMRRELGRLGEVVDFTTLPARRRSPLRAALRSFLPPSLRAALRGLQRSPAAGSPAPAEDAFEAASRLSRHVQEQVERAPVDVLFACCVSTLLYGLEVDAPIVYASDTTARLIHGSYRAYRELPAEQREAREAIERVGLHRAAQLALATDLARRSAIDDFGVAPGRVHTVPLGANVVPTRPLRAPAPLAAPSRRRLRLLLVAHDPQRKRTDLAVEAVALLRARGWDARLDLIGATTELARSAPFVRCLGRLDLGSAIDRALHRRALAACHLLILPSEAEAFGIAPCEAAHFGRPSVVSDAGGLPEVVVDGVTGAVVPVDGGAGAEDYADAALRLAGDPLRWGRACEASLRRAHEVLSWERWGEGVSRLLLRAAADGGRAAA